MKKIIILALSVLGVLTQQDTVSAQAKPQTRSIDYSVVHGDGRRDTLTFFNFGRDVFTSDITEEYERRGIMPSPELQAGLNMGDPSFSETYPNVSFWLGDGGVMMCSKWFESNRQMAVDTVHQDDYWLGNWWFGGVSRR